jgi:hypothetical protein
MMILRHLLIQPLHCLMLCRTGGVQSSMAFVAGKQLHHEGIVAGARDRI